MRISWNYFFDKFGKRFDSLSTYMVIDSIIHYSGKSAVLLCIDEATRVLPEGHSDLKNIKILLPEQILFKLMRDNPE